MSETPPSSPSFQALIDYIESKNFNHTPYPEEKRVTLSMSGKNAHFRFTARITNEDDYLQVTANYPFSVREEKLRSSTAELITRANYCMPLGKFEMDMADGEVRFHLTHVIGELGLTSEMIEKHFMTAYFTMDRYFPAFMQHLHAGYTPEDAVFHAEIDYNADRVEETPKPAPKPKEKSKAKAKPASSSDASSAQPATAASDAGSLPSSIDPRQGSSTPPAPTSKKPHRKKSEGIQGQGELPL
jgi:hypothetical protein